MESTPIDLIINGKKWRLPGSVYTRLVNHGRWKLDNVKGKALCLIELTIPKIIYDSQTILENITLNFTPSEKFQDELLNSWLEAELKNDMFVFAKPTLDKSRPSQLNIKIKRIQAIINSWKNRLL